MPIDITNKKISKYLLFGALYTTEGMYIAVAWLLTPLYLLQQQFSPEIVTISSGAIMLPWIGKFLFGYYIDRHSHKGKKPFILHGGILASITLLLVPIINPETHFIGFILLLFIGQIGIGFLDLSADAWAIHITNKSERGKLSGSMTIGLYAGMLLGSAFLTPLAEAINFKTAYFTGGLILLPIITSVIFIKDTVQTKKIQIIIQPLIKELKQQKTIFFLLFLTIVSLHSGIISLTVPLYMNISLSLSVALIGFISALFSITRALGSFILGAISDVYGRTNTLLLILTSTLVFTLLLLTANNELIITLLYAIIGFHIGGLFAVLFALSMDKTSHRYTALQFGIYMAFINLGELSGGSISGPLITLLDFQRVFLYATWITGLSLLFLYILRQLFLKKN